MQNFYSIQTFTVLIITSLLLAGLSINKIKNQLLKILIIAIYLFIVFNLPLISSNYNPFLNIWPNNWTYSYGSLLSNQVEGQNYYDHLFEFLIIAGDFILFYSIPIFIYFINSQIPAKRSINWIPLIHLYSLSKDIKNLLNANYLNSLVILAWAIFSFSWVYYRFIALPLAFVGLDSFSFIDYLLFGNQYNEATSKLNQSAFSSTPIGYGYYYLGDLASIIASTSAFLAAIVFLIILHKLKNSE